MQEEENADESILKSISEELIKTLQQNKTNEKFWYLLLAALMAVSVGLQTAVILCWHFVSGNIKIKKNKKVVDNSLAV